MAKKRSSQRPAAPALAVAEPAAPSALFQVCSTAALLTIYLGFLAHPINLTISDLGRHLKNGELFFQSGFIAHTNLYAYSHPDQPFVNHHWGSGVIFYLIERAGEFSGLSLFFLAVSAATLWIYFNLAARYGSFALAVLLAITVMPVLITRHEIRPEAFSYLMSGLFLHLLWDCRERRRAVGWLWVLPFLQIVWVNLHIYFFIGILLVGVFLFQSLIVHFVKKSPASSSHACQWKVLAAVLLATFAASCINPAGVRGAVYPLFIFQGYEFPVIENYSVPAILRAGFQFLPLHYFLIVLGVLCLSWVYVGFKDRARFSLTNLLLSLFFTAMAWWTIRNFALFAFFALPLTAANLARFTRSESMRWINSSSGIAVAAGAVALVLALIKPEYFFGGGRGSFGIGVKEGNLAALEFMRREKLQGPIFNGFDVGGYLIYALYPRERVYVDNRPEAYPARFFPEDYFSLLVNDQKWRANLDAHRFNAIVINPASHSAAAESFTVRRMLEPEWAAVFYDKDLLILGRRFGANQAIIVKHELARESVLQKAE
jgi:hypothetical protein